MTDQPQIALEEIELIPHPMDAWRAALNALIACAPGDGPAIAAHLAEARQQALVFVDRTPASAGTAKLIDRLMLIGAGRLVGQQLNARARGATAHPSLTDTEAQEISERLMDGLGRRKRLAQAMGTSTQSVYRHVLSLADALGVSEDEALKHLETRHLHGADR